MKKVLAIMGSPRKNMNTDKLLDEFLKQINPDLFTIEKVYLKDLDIKHCTGCEFCNNTWYNWRVWLFEILEITEKLENLILDKKIYPITILPSIGNFNLQQFAKKGLLLAQDLLPYSAQDLSGEFGISAKDAEKISAEVLRLIK